MYRVIAEFTDLQDNGYKYKVGDIYPREGYSPTDLRIKELTSVQNRQKKQLIKEVAVEIAVDVDKPKRRNRKSNK